MKSLWIKVARKVIVCVIAAILFIGVIPALAPAVTHSDDIDYSVCAASKVYYARYSKKYHRTKRCRSLRRSKKIYAVTKTAAKRKGLKKCKLCW